MPGSGGRKHRGGGKPDERRHGPSGPPPDVTGDADQYIRRLKEDATPLIVYLTDGSEVRGHIEYFDRHMIKITRERGPHLFVRKDEIRYWAEL